MKIRALIAVLALATPALASDPVRSTTSPPTVGTTCEPSGTTVHDTTVYVDRATSDRYTCDSSSHNWARVWDGTRHPAAAGLSGGDEVWFVPSDQAAPLLVMHGNYEQMPGGGKANVKDADAALVVPMQSSPVGAGHITAFFGVGLDPTADWLGGWLIDMDNNYGNLVLHGYNPSGGTVTLDGIGSFGTPQIISSGPLFTIGLSGNSSNGYAFAQRSGACQDRAAIRHSTSGSSESCENTIAWPIGSFFTPITGLPTTWSVCDGSNARCWRGPYLAANQAGMTLWCSVSGTSTPTVSVKPYYCGANQTTCTAMNSTGTQITTSNVQIGMSTTSLTGGNTLALNVTATSGSPQTMWCTWSATN